MRFCCSCWSLLASHHVLKYTRRTSTMYRVWLQTDIAIAGPCLPPAVVLVHARCSCHESCMVARSACARRWVPALLKAAVCGTSASPTIARHCRRSCRRVLLTGTPCWEERHMCALSQSPPLKMVAFQVVFGDRCKCWRHRLHHSSAIAVCVRISLNAALAAARYVTMREVPPSMATRTRNAACACVAVWCETHRTWALANARGSRAATRA